MKIEAERLKTTAELALANARRQLETTGQVTVVFGLLLCDNSDFAWLELPERLAPVMNDHSAKTLLFHYMRAVVNAVRATATVLVTDSWAGIPTEKHKQLAEENPEELERLAKTLVGMDAWEAAGLATRAEAICVTVQTPESALMLQQVYERSDQQILWGERIEQVMPQATFFGKTKMFGETVSE